MVLRIYPKEKLIEFNDIFLHQIVNTSDKMLTGTEFENLINQSESSILDFKMENFKLIGDNDGVNTAKFINSRSIKSMTPCLINLSIKFAAVPLSINKQPAFVIELNFTRAENVR